MNSSISPYLIEGPETYVEKQTKPLCNVPELVRGNEAIDDGNYLLDNEEKEKLFKKIMKTQIETGMPYLFFKDTVNGMNPNKHDGMIGSGNLCQESFSNFSPTSYYKFSNLRYFFLKSHIYIGT